MKYDILTEGKNSDFENYSDYGKISEYAVPAMEWAVSSGLIQGYDNMLSPGGSATRAQVATILYRFLDLVS